MKTVLKKTNFLTLTSDFFSNSEYMQKVVQQHGCKI